jgi:integrase
MRCLALRYFAGLRTSEATAIEELEIKTEFIEVTARKAKTRRRRLVPVLPVLRAWLDLGGALPLAQVNNRLRAVVVAAGVPWPNNAPRHSFVSYHLAKFQNAGQTALLAGHGEQMLFNHYREIVTSQAAEEFFNLFPQK